MPMGSRGARAAGPISTTPVASWSLPCHRGATGAFADSSCLPPRSRPALQRQISDGRGSGLDLTIVCVGDGSCLAVTDSGRPMGRANQMTAATASTTTARLAAMAQRGRSVDARAAPPRSRFARAPRPGFRPAPRRWSSPVRRHRSRRRAGSPNPDVRQTFPYPNSANRPFNCRRDSATRHLTVPSGMPNIPLISS